MNNDYLNGEEMLENKSTTAIVKAGHFERPSTFAKRFSKYDPKTGQIIKVKKEQYITQYGGIPLGTEGDKVLVDSSDSHSLILGATGSKKSRLIIMPSVRILADAGESMIISDPKAEIYDRTATYLERKGYSLEIINLRNPSVGNSWNPLSLPFAYYRKDENDKAYEFANDIAANLALSEIAQKDPYWDYCARDLFFGLELLLFKYCKERSFNENTCNIRSLIKLRYFLFNPDKYATINSSNSKLIEYIDSDFIISSALSSTINAPKNTKASILSVFDEKMRCFMIQPNLLNLLSANQVNFDNWTTKKKALFVIMPDEKTAYHKLVTLFVKQSYEYLIYQAQKEKNGNLPIRINYLLDEFASLPAINDFSSMISAARSRNIRFVLVVQSKHQLLDKYGTMADTIQSNCSNWIFLTSREIKLLEEISILCGIKGNTGKSLVPVDFLQHLNKEKGEAIILSERLYPYISQLLDIDKYDGAQFGSKILVPIDQTQFYYIDFENDCIKFEGTFIKQSIGFHPKSKRDTKKTYSSNLFKKRNNAIFGSIDDD